MRFSPGKLALPYKSDIVTLTVPLALRKWLQDYSTHHYCGMTMYTIHARNIEIHKLATTYAYEHFY